MSEYEPRRLQPESARRDQDLLLLREILDDPMLAGQDRAAA